MPAMEEVSRARRGRAIEGLLTGLLHPEGVGEQLRKSAVDSATTLPPTYLENPRLRIARAVNVRMRADLVHRRGPAKDRA
jgi:hypothetical protein